MNKYPLDQVPKESKFGQGMYVIAWLLLFVLLTIFFANWLSYQNNPNKTLRIQDNAAGDVAVLIRPNRFHHYVFTGKVNGVPVEFMLDTGASTVSVPESLAKRLNLLRGHAIQVQTASSVVRVYSTFIDLLEIGPIQLSNISATINPYMNSSQILLGMSALRQLNFSQENGQLILKQGNQR